MESALPKYRRDGAEGYVHGRGCLEGAWSTRVASRTRGPRGRPSPRGERLPAESAVRVFRRRAAAALDLAARERPRCPFEPSTHLYSQQWPSYGGTCTAPMPWQRALRQVGVSQWRKLTCLVPVRRRTRDHCRTLGSSAVMPSRGQGRASARHLADSRTRSIGAFGLEVHAKCTVRDTLMCTTGVDSSLRLGVGTWAARALNGRSAGWQEFEASF